MEVEARRATDVHPPVSEEEWHHEDLRVPLPSLRLRVSERRLLLSVVDALIVNGALVAALLAWTDFPVSARALIGAFKWFATLTAVWFLCALFFDCYDLARAASVVHTARSSGSAALATVVTYTFIPWLTPALQSRGLIVLFCGATLAGVVGWRVAYSRIFVQPWFEQRALVIGAGRAGRTLAEVLRRAPKGATNPFRGTGYHLVGFIDDDPHYVGSQVRGIPVLGDSRSLVRVARVLGVDEIILAITHRHAINEKLFDAMLQCRELGFRVATMSKLYERLLGRVPVDHIGRDLHMVVPMEEAAGERLYGAAKRLADVLMGCGGLAAMGALTPFIALGNLLTCPGPLFYRQRRVGRGGETFHMLKFRTMAADAEKKSGAVWASADDDRVTPVGRLLRPARLDELPQFLNVIKGEMSAIGPRPERPEFVETLAEQLPFYRARHAVRPGITGWAQIHFDYGNSVQDAKVKLEYDLYYVKHAGPFLDLRILLQTIPVMLRGKGY